MSNNAIKSYDILIIGGSLVGAALACALRGHGLQIGIIEPQERTLKTKRHFDVRGMALSYGSRKILEAWGVWPALDPVATPMEDIHISDRGHFGKTRLSAARYNVPALGYVIEMPLLLKAFYDRLAECDDITWISPARVENLSPSDTGYTLQVVNDAITQTLTAPLTIAADGICSNTRKLLKIDTTEWDYHQSAISTNITVEPQHFEFTAFERFTERGPLALLPMSEQRYALIWTVKPHEVQTYLERSDADFIQALHTDFGYRLGPFRSIGKRQAFPLRMIRANQPFHRGIMLMGNAAHTVHPISGQGFNVSLRDVELLASMLLAQRAAGGALGEIQWLKRFVEKRQADQVGVIRMTDLTTRIFSNDFLPVSFARNLGLMVLNLIPGMKRRLALKGMGVIE